MRSRGKVDSSSSCLLDGDAADETAAGGRGSGVVVPAETEVKGGGIILGGGRGFAAHMLAAFRFSRSRREVEE